MIQMGIQILEKWPSDTYEESLNQFLLEKREKYYPSTLDPDDVCFMLVQSLFFRSSQQWNEIKNEMLVRLLLLGHKRFKSQNPKLELDPVSNPKDSFQALKPFLFFYFFISQIHKIFATILKQGQPSSSTPEVSSSGTSDSKGKGKVGNAVQQSLKNMLKENSFLLVPKFVDVIFSFFFPSDLKQLYDIFFLFFSCLKPLRMN